MLELLFNNLPNIFKRAENTRAVLCTVVCKASDFVSLILLFFFFWHINCTENTDAISWMHGNHCFFFNNGKHQKNHMYWVFKASQNILRPLLSLSHPIFEIFFSGTKFANECIRVDIKFETPKRCHFQVLYSASVEGFFPGRGVRNWSGCFVAKAMCKLTDLLSNHPPYGVGTQTKNRLFTL